MLIKELCYSNTLNDSYGYPFTVDYYITKTSDLISDEQIPYGIIVEKSQEHKSIETYLASQCFSKKCNAEMLLKKLCHNSVTPVAAAECVDILLDDCNFRY